MSGIMEMTFRRRAPVPSAPPHHTVTRHNHKMTPEGESELSCPHIVPTRWWLTALEWWLALAPPPTALCTHCPGETLMTPQGAPEDPLWCQP